MTDPFSERDPFAVPSYESLTLFAVEYREGDGLPGRPNNYIFMGRWTELVVRHVLRKALTLASTDPGCALGETFGYCLVGCLPEHAEDVNDALSNDLAVMFFAELDGAAKRRLRLRAV